MPGTFTHMLVFEDVISELEKDIDCEDLVKMLKENKNYGTLGSIGPDLPYFESVTSTLYFLLTSRTDEPFHLEKWAGQMHSKDPNVLPLKMILTSLGGMTFPGDNGHLLLDFLFTLPPIR